MTWTQVILSLVFVSSAAYLLKFSHNYPWKYLRLIQKTSITGGVLPPRPSFRRRKNTSSTPRVSYAATAFTRERALRSFSRYDSLAATELASKRRGLNTLRGRHVRIADDIGYNTKLDCFRTAIEINKRVTNAITRLALLQDEVFVADDTRISLLGANRWTDDGPTDLARVVEALKHCVRDWSVDGLEERTRVFSPILRVLAQVPLNMRKDTKILVPGAGLGRLAWEIARMGFDVTANEVSSYMTLPLKALLAEEITPTSDFHTVSPHSSWFSHTRSNNILFQSSSFPDILPRTDSGGALLDSTPTESKLKPDAIYAPGGKFKLVELDFLSLTPPDREEPNLAHTQDLLQHGLPSIVTAQPRDRGYDFIVTLFFIDTATNILAYLDQIYALLRLRSPILSSQPGTGTWINLGPLLWPSGAALEPSLEEVLTMSKRVGFDIVGESPNAALPAQAKVNQNQERTNELETRRTVECQYTANRAGMMKWMYQAEFWVAKRRQE